MDGEVTAPKEIEVTAEEVETPAEAEQRMMEEMKFEMEAEGPMVRASEIIEMLAKLMSRPIRVRGVVGKPLGIFRPKEQVARIRRANWVAVATHETAHMLERIHEQALGGITRKAWENQMPSDVRAEFRALDYDPTKQRIFEGFAEFFRHYITGDMAQTIAPNAYAWFHDVFLRDNPHLIKGVEKIRAKVTAYRGQGPVNLVKSMIRFTGQEAQLPLGERIKRGYHMVRSLFEDDVYIIERNERDILGGKTALGAVSPSKLARTVTQKSAAIAREWGLHGMTDLAGNKIGPALREIFGRKGIRGDEQNALAYTVALRAVNLWRRERPIDPGIPLGAAQATVRRLRTPARDKFAQEITKFGDQSLQYLVDAGVISPESKAKMQLLNPVYIQFFRVFDKERGFGVGGRRIGDQPRPTRRIAGAGEEIRDPIESMAGQMERFVSIANKTRVARALVDLVKNNKGFGKYVSAFPSGKVPVQFELERIAKQLQKAGVDLADVDLDTTITLFMNSPRTPTGGNIVGFWRNGKRHFYELDPELYRSIMALDFQRAHPLIDIFLGKLARTMRLGATGVNPGFTLFTNLVRDYWTMLNQSQFNPVTTTLRWFKHLGLQVGMRETDVLRAWKAMGGEVAQPLGLDRRSIQQFREEILANTPRRILYNVVRHPWEFAREALSLTEAATRLAEFETTLREMGWKPGDKLTEDMAIEAANNAAEVTVNFSRAGSWGRFINQVVAFHNPNIQGLAKFGRSHRRSPLSSAMRGVGTVTSLAFLNWWVNKDDPDWTNLPPWLKYGFLNWKLGNNWIRIPIPFEWWFAYGALPIAVLETIDKKKPGELEKMAKQATKQMTPPVFPSVATPVAEVWRNKSFYSGKPIESKALQRLIPSERKQPYTTQTSVKIAQILSGAGVEVSPVQVDHVLRGETGGIYTDLIRMAEQATGVAGPKPIREPADLPVVGRIFARDGESALIDEMYDQLDHLAQKQSTFNYLKDRGDESFVKYELSPLEKIQLHHLRETERRMKELRKAYNTSTNRAERRELFDAMKQLSKNAID